MQKPRFRFGSVFSKNLGFRFGTVNRHSTTQEFSGCRLEVGRCQLLRSVIGYFFGNFKIGSVIRFRLVKKEKKTDIFAYCKVRCAPLDSVRAYE